MENANTLLVLALLCISLRFSCALGSEAAFHRSAEEIIPLEEPTEEPLTEHAYRSGFIGSRCFPRDHVDNNLRHECDRPCRRNDRRLCRYYFSLDTYEAHNEVACGPDCVVHGNCNKCIRTDNVTSDLLVVNYRFPTKSLVACTNDFIQVVVANHMTDFVEDITEADLEINIEKNLRNFKVEDAEAVAQDLAHEVYENHQMRRHHGSVQLSEEDQLEPILEPGEPTTFHWHGMLQKGTPYSDGVPYVTQEVVDPGMAFQYLFQATHGGTHFMHSHFGTQRGIGLAGAMIFRDSPGNNPHVNLYDFDRTSDIIFITDYGHDRSNRADVVLINGRGRYFVDDQWQGEPFSFHVKPNRKYRFRVIYNCITNLPIVFSVDDHELLLIAVDGVDVEPVVLGSIVLANAERADFVLHTNKDVDSYFLRFWAFNNPAVNQVALLEYEDATPADPYEDLVFPAAPPGLQYNKPTAGPGTAGVVTTAELENVEPLTTCAHSTSCEQYFLDLTVSGRGFQINNISMEFPTTSLLKQVYDNGYLDESNFCNKESLEGSNCDQVSCRCTHVVELKLHRCYEIVLTGSHPFHLHGYAFNVVAMGLAPTGTKMTKALFLEMDQAGQVHRNLINPPGKDTVPVPTNGYTVIRICTDNPGFWAAHCHIELHADMGMIMVFKVGSNREIRKSKTESHNSTPFWNNECFD